MLMITEAKEFTILKLVTIVSWSSVSGALRHEAVQPSFLQIGNGYWFNCDHKFLEFYPQR